MTDWITCREAAAMAGCTESAIKRWAQCNKITAEHDDRGMWRIDEESLRAHLATLKVPNLKRATPESQPTVRIETVLAEALDRERAAERAVASLLREELVELRTERAELRAEREHLKAELRAREAEIRALLSGDLQGVLMSWHRALEPRNRPAMSTIERSISPTDIEQPTNLQGEMSVEPRSHRTSPEPATVALTKPTNIETESKPTEREKPKGSPFAQECLRLTEEGRSPEEIAKILGKTAQNVKMALRSLKPA